MIGEFFILTRQRKRLSARCRPAAGACLLLVLGVAVYSSGSEPAASWPGGTGVELGRRGAAGGLPMGIEPSGVVWHPAMQTLVVVGDDGTVSRLDPGGRNWTTFHPGGDLESVAVGDPGAPFVYLGSESPDAIVEFDLAKGVLTGAEWDLAPFMGGEENRGLEALTSHAGLFYAGQQASGRVYVFRLGSEGKVELVSVISPSPERGDISGLHFDPESQVLFAIYDGGDVIRQMRVDGSVLREHRAPGRDQEGLAVVSDCSRGQATIFVAQDSGEVLRYAGYPVACGRRDEKAISGSADSP